MKKILIVSQAMEIGGAERALLGLLEEIDTSKYQVDLFLMRHSGELMKYIPNNIHLLDEIPQCSVLGIPMSILVRKHFWKLAYGRIVGKIRTLLFATKHGVQEAKAIADEYSHKYTVDYMPCISDVEYDLAISFLAPHYLVDKKVNAKKKIAWIHTDYKTIEIDVESELKMWSKYDNIVSISEQVTKSFLKIFPGLKEKVLVIENIMPIQYMEGLVHEFSTEDEMPVGNSIKLLSIGRFCTAKNFDNIPKICKTIREKGMDVYWYLIGYGEDEELIRCRIEESGMEDYVIMLGKKENPYPYIRACDIYIQPSRYEGKCVSVIEAQMLHKPVIITNYQTSRSQLQDGYDGVIVSMHNQCCAEDIAKVITNDGLQKKLIENTRKKDYANKREIKKIYQFLE